MLQAFGRSTAHRHKTVRPAQRQGRPTPEPEFNTDVDDEAWIINVITPFGGAEKVIAEIKNSVFEGEKSKEIM